MLDSIVVELDQIRHTHPRLKQRRGLKLFHRLEQLHAEDSENDDIVHLGQRVLAEVFNTQRTHPFAA